MHIKSQEERVADSWLKPWPDVDDFAIAPVPTAIGRRRYVQRFIKRTVDIVVSLVLFVVLLPFVLVFGHAILVDSPGPLLFMQRRVGRGGRDFSLLKFRTMVAGADALLTAHVGSDHELRQEWEETRKLRNDPRVTRVGRFLRKHSIDELPQILNVLRGDMSLVGPRPVAREELPLLGQRATDILRVRPGLTGLWAVSGRSDVSYQERAALEYRYAVGWSLWMDLKILLRTIPVVLRGRGAY
jgi:exopolysaccharide production protein ExoY